MADIHPPGSLAGARRRRLASLPDPGSGRSLPMRLEIPAIDLVADVTTIGLGADGNLELPPPSGDATVCWYQGSPTPGETGSAVIVGHVDPAPGGGPGVFAGLRLLRPGDPVGVGRADGSVIAFVVSGIAVYPRAHFPGDRLAGPRDYPALALMTCGGAGGTNLIVFARRA
jgi:sortase family protein